MWISEVNVMVNENDGATVSQVHELSERVRVLEKIARRVAEKRHDEARERDWPYDGHASRFSECDEWYCATVRGE